MSNNRNLADLLDTNGDVKSDALDNVDGLPDAIDVDASAPADSLAIDSSGRVGIGTSSPGTTLDIRATGTNTRFNSVDSTGCYVTFANNGTAKGYVGSSYHLFSGSPSSNDFAVRAEGNLQFSAGGSTERMRIDSSGRVTMPYQPHVFCRGYGGSSNNIVLYDSVVTNTGNHFNNTTGLFTAPVSGVYYVGAFSGFKNATNYLGWGISYNGSNDVYGWSASVTNLNHANNTVNYVRYLSAGDTVGAWVAPNYTVPYTTSVYVCFSVTLLG